MTDSKIAKYYESGYKNINALKKSKPKRYLTLVLGAICQENNVKDPEELEAILKLYKLQKDRS